MTAPLRNLKKGYSKYFRGQFHYREHVRTIGMDTISHGIPGSLGRMFEPEGYPHAVVGVLDDKLTLGNKSNAPTHERALAA